MIDSGLLVGVVADTHVPDRVDRLHPHLMEQLQQARVDLILHAGDVSVPAVLDALGQIAPVTAARGNRDFFFKPQLPMAAKLKLGAREVAVLHGHGGWLSYSLDKFRYLLYGYSFERYVRIARHAAPDAQVIVFGHTHTPVMRWVDGQLFFNPGSASFGKHLGENPSYGLLRFSPEGQVSGEIVALTGYQVVGGEWRESLNNS